MRGQGPQSCVAKARIFLLFLFFSYFLFFFFSFFKSSLVFSFFDVMLFLLFFVGCCFYSLYIHMHIHIYISLSIHIYIYVYVNSDLFVSQTPAIAHPQRPDCELRAELLGLDKALSGVPSGRRNERGVEKRGEQLQMYTHGFLTNGS